MVSDTVDAGDDRGDGEVPALNGSDPAPALLWNDDSFRARVRELAKKKGIGLGELSKRSGVSEPWLRHPPRKGRNVDTIMKTAAGLGVDVDDLIRAGASPSYRSTTDGDEAAPTHDEVLDRLARAWDLAAHTYVALSRRPSFNVEQMAALLNELTGKAAADIS